MASFTPSSLTFQSLGSMNLTIAHLNEDIISGTDYWTSGIPGIRSVMVNYYSGTPLMGSTSCLSVVWTASSGTIWTIMDRTSSNTGLEMWILSGGPSTKD